ncbi:hypothetical protein VFPPC_18723 [Pochonia chlamydosporia 170]|uniref:Uncharacterized protein n=1 Tax=Pochonia chlamydosporia 170 TaxID=1380566 RepID=A0A219AS10_METCM|nr:hypothetical protein VFPPC_18723 [Pochonia chlamydosporia 170]OWT43550.1 hypothetical protein VFPPC_18723 [Pochonia chlamydosporia 170]
MMENSKDVMTLCVCIIIADVVLCWPSSNGLDLIVLKHVLTSSWLAESDNVPACHTTTTQINQSWVALEKIQEEETLTAHAAGAAGAADVAGSTRQDGGWLLTLDEKLDSNQGPGTRRINGWTVKYRRLLGVYDVRSLGLFKFNATVEMMQLDGAQRCLCLREVVKHRMG